MGGDRVKSVLWDWLAAGFKTLIVAAMMLVAAIVIYRAVTAVVGEANAVTFATIVLVLITGYYALQNRVMAQEMRAGRLQSVLPVITLDLIPLGALNMMAGVRNVGAGAALDLDLRLIFVPKDSERESEVRHIRVPYLGPGETFEYLPPEDDRGEWTFEALGRTLAAVRLKGSVTDVLDQQHPVLREVAEIDERQRLLRESRRRRNEAPDERAVRELEKIRKGVEKGANELQTIRRRPEIEELRREQAAAEADDRPNGDAR